MQHHTHTTHAHFNAGSHIHLRAIPAHLCLLFSWTNGLHSSLRFKAIHSDHVVLENVSELVGKKRLTNLAVSLLSLGC